jgi:hypothetical protein
MSKILKTRLPIFPCSPPQLDELFLPRSLTMTASALLPIVRRHCSARLPTIGHNSAAAAAAAAAALLPSE